MPAPEVFSNGGLLLSTESGSIPNAESQGDVRQQLANLTDMVRQVVGSAVVVPGDGSPSDPLNAAFELYVDPVRGVDTFAHGEFNSYDPAGATVEEQIENKLKRIANQRLVCGYTPQRPFRTINRAAIEAAIITSRNWFINDPKTHVDCILIHLSAGVHIVYNNPGTGTVTAWPDGYNPSVADLIAFNPPEGGVIIPRYASIQGANLRKTTLRPSYVPAVANEAANYSNRSCFFRLTTSALCFGFSFFDSWDEERSHHLLDTFHGASQAELTSFYSKVATACAAGADLDPARLVPRGSEYSTVSAAIDQTQPPTQAWDVVSSASAYIYNCSIRSKWGMGGVFLDGNKLGGLKSFVIAQFTGVSLQNDLSCWQIYSGGNWIQPANYAAYINANPDDVRMNPSRMTRHISAVNGAFIQEVSVFAIGQGIHHYVDSGAEITITNSNSSFGGCAAVAKGYRTFAFDADSNWSVGRIRVPRAVEDKSGNIRKIFLGSVASAPAGAGDLVLEEPLDSSVESDSVPTILLKDGYTLRQGTYLWVENPSGPDWRAQIAASAWDASSPDTITLSGALTESGTNIAAGDDAIGRRVYIRRIADTRSEEERRVSLELTNTDSARLPTENFVLQTDPGRAGGAISRELASTGQELLLVTLAGKSNQQLTGVRTASVTIRRGNGPKTYANNAYYRTGEIVRSGNKHYQATRDGTASGATPSIDQWTETFVHMPSDFQPEEAARNASPLLIFDSDTSSDENSTTLGYNFSTVYTSGGLIRDQYRSGSDYRGVEAFLLSLGFSAAAAEAALVPRPRAERNLDPSSAVDFPTAPSGGAATSRANWAVEFRRPSIVRLYGHAYEWAGWLNYSKAIPSAQKELSSLNKFTYYGTSWNGGRVVNDGANEQGQRVSPKGLESIETGRAVDVDNLDFPDIDVPDVLNNLAVNNLAVTGTLDLTGVTNPLFPDGLFPFLPDVGDPQASITLKALGIGTEPVAGQALRVQGSAASAPITLAGSTIDCRLGNYFVSTVSSSITYSFTNVPAGMYEMTIEVIYSAGAITLPAGSKYLFGLAPVLVAGNRYDFICRTRDQGARWHVTVLEFPA